MSRARAIFNKPVVRYVFVGGLSYLAELTIIFLLRTIGLDGVSSVGVAFWVGLTVSFLLQKLVAFKNHERKVSHLTRQSTFYMILVAFNYIFTLVFVGATTALLGLYLSRTIALGITTVWNYFFYSRLIFKHHD